MRWNDPLTRDVCLIEKQEQQENETKRNSNTTVNSLTERKSDYWSTLGPPTDRRRSGMRRDSAHLEGSHARASSHRQSSLCFPVKIDRIVIFLISNVYFAI